MVLGVPEEKEICMPTNTLRRLTVLAGLVLNLGYAASAHAALEGRDLDGNLATFEAYYDTVLDITWLGDANHAKTSGYDADGLMDWNAAVAWADQLNINGYADWRLPDVSPANGSTYDYAGSYDGHTDAGWNITSPSSELAYMFYVNLGNEGSNTTTGALTSCGNSSLCLTQPGPFVNLTPGYGSWYGEVFWGYGYPGYAWAFGSSGYQSGAFQVTFYDAWAVHPGDIGVAAIPEPETYAMLLAGLVAVGFAARRRG
jgi:hypothetical protein